jgi:exosortase/archaeosortase family protein
MNALRNWAALNRPFLFFIGRFLLTFFSLSAIYAFYLVYVEKQGDLDLVTYWISRGSHEFARAVGVADCEWSCFLDGCYVGRPGRMVNILEGCNGLRLAIVYAAYIIGIGGWNWRSLLQMTVGLVVVQIFNIIRIGGLIALRDFGGDLYFYFIKYVFGVWIYGSIIILWLLKPRIDRWLGAKS